VSVRQRPRPPVRQQLTTGTLVDGDPAATSRLLSDVGAAVKKLYAVRVATSKVTATLTAGENRVNHGLGRKPSSVTVTPSVADATFAYQLTSSDERQVVITTAGTTQTDATIEVR
jgi:hypothetical protein